MKESFLGSFLHNSSNIIIALLLFGAVILFHELGHFLLAKANKIAVLEFSLGMGPRIVSFAKTDQGFRVKFFGSGKYFEEHEEYKNHTVYSLKILPIGGSCMMLGEMDDIEDDRAFGKKSVLARMAVIFAGPFFNFILAFAMALCIIGMIGYDKAEITRVEQGMPVAESGFRDGDVITRINDKNVVVNRDVIYYLQFHPVTDEPIELTAERDGKEIKATVTPKLVTDGNGKEVYRLGFAYGNNERTKTGPGETIKYAAYEVKFWISTTIESLGMLISGRVSPKELSGPVGIVHVIGDAVDQSRENEKPEDVVKYVFLNLLSLGIMLTANLGVVNLLPIPVLDGGRLLFLFIEGIRRKPIPEKVENGFNIGGIAVLMLLMVFTLVNDIMNLIPK